MTALLTLEQAEAHLRRLAYDDDVCNVTEKTREALRMVLEHRQFLIDMVLDDPAPEAKP